MPQKIRELKQMLRQAGFTEIAGKGSHTNWVHPNYLGKLTISGQNSADAKRYQEKAVREAIAETQQDRDLEDDDEASTDEI
jgi:predicted RNA binding protein YcfA (HicA-like mRNA interferase family)